MLVFFRWIGILCCFQKWHFGFESLSTT